MVVRSRLARALAVTAISLGVTVAAAPASTATALTPPIALITARAAPPSGWVTTTDPASGVSVMLPGRLVSDNGYLVGIATLGRVTEESALIQLHQQVLGTLHLVV